MTMTVRELYEHAVQLRQLLEIKKRRLEGTLTPASRRLLFEQADALSERINEILYQCYRLDPDLLTELESSGPVPGFQPQFGMVPQT